MQQDHRQQGELGQEIKADESLVQEKENNVRVSSSNRFSWVLWHTNHCRLFNAKFSLYIYIKHIRFGWVNGKSSSHTHKIYMNC